ncbi:hypothetical protein [Dyella telluris]|uniref:Uncharacterized protein n=1 Tax=Dyella telluris TaxID=2763498 RepID=A0A7G8Q408_9GAMM|nr:hypothetical protein [Dyella telluris]QNK01516.1 hypothetical protein H8F01_21185 [Dyella telluris]
MELRHIATLTVACIGLAACGSSSINKVKSSPISNGQAFTVGQALDNRKVCAATSWDTHKDERNREIVEYRCELKDATTYFKTQTTEWLASNEQHVKDVADVYDGKLQQMKAEVDEAKARLAQAQANKSSTADAQTDFDSLIRGIQNQIDSGQTQLDEYTKTYDQFKREAAVERDQSNSFISGFAAVAKSEEVYQWTIGPSGDPVLIYGSYVLEDRSGNVIKEVRYFRPDIRMDSVVANKANNYGEYNGGDTTALFKGML